MYRREEEMSDLWMNPFLNQIFPEWFIWIHLEALKLQLIVISWKNNENSNFKLSSFVFFSRKKRIQVWNNMRVLNNENFHFVKVYSWHRASHFAITRFRISMWKERQKNKERDYDRHTDGESNKSMNRWKLSKSKEEPPNSFLKSSRSIFQSHL